MSKTIEIPRDLSTLDAEDLKYLHERGQISTADLAKALGTTVADVQGQLADATQNAFPLKDRANTGDANTAGLTKEEHEAAAAALASEEDEEDDDGEGLVAPYDGHTNDELRAEISRRNEGREEHEQISLEGKKDDLVTALEEDDEENGE